MDSKATGSKRVLVVEDDKALQNMLAQGLGKAGYEVLSADTGEQALTLLREWGARINWLFVDIRLPGVINGWVVGSEFTLNHPLRPVIYTSGFDAEAARQVPGSVFMRKPVDVREVVTAFTQLAAKYEAQTGKMPSLQ